MKMKWFTSSVLPTDLTLYNGTGLKQIVIIENLIPLQIPAYRAVNNSFESIASAVLFSCPWEVISMDKLKGIFLLSFGIWGNFFKNPLTLVPYSIILYGRRR